MDYSNSKRDTADSSFDDDFWALPLKNLSLLMSPKNPISSYIGQNRIARTTLIPLYAKYILHENKCTLFTRLLCTIILM